MTSQKRYASKRLNMVELRAKVRFKEPKIIYDVLDDETRIEPNVIVMDLYHFGIMDRSILRSQYEFKPVDARDHMMNDYCDISGEEFLALVGKTKQEAEVKLQEKDVSDTEISAYNVVTFYKKLAQNTIDKVTLRIVEF